MSGRALSFGSVAEAYERYRPGYPEQLVDAVLAYAGRPIATALEVGAGTGKATRAVAATGIVVTATEPDEAMLTELRARVPGVATLRTTFEELPLTTTYDLVYAAAAMHWTRPEGRWDRVAALLRRGGVFASLGGPLDIADPGLAAVVAAARAPFLATDDVPSPDGTPEESPLQWPGTELTASPLFEDVRQVELPTPTVMARDDYVGLLSTVSAWLELPTVRRTAALDAVRAVLPAQVGLRRDLVLHLARRADGD
nr:class I SAM-dependent methyltransferase [uncultured Nocardioides sp.]